MSGQHPRKATSCATYPPQLHHHPGTQATNTYLQGMWAVVMTAVALVAVVVAGLVVGCLLSGDVLATASSSDSGPAPAAAAGELSHVRACVCVACVPQCGKIERQAST